jgi:hypothetical protein
MSKSGGFGTNRPPAAAQKYGRFLGYSGPRLPAEGGRAPASAYITHLFHTARAAIARKSTELSADDVDAGINAALDQWQESINSPCYRATKSQQPDNIYREVVLACALARADDLGHFVAARASTVRFDQRCPQRPSHPD